MLAVKVSLKVEYEINYHILIWCENLYIIVTVITQTHFQNIVLLTITLAKKSLRFTILSRTFVTYNISMK